MKQNVVLRRFELEMFEKAISLESSVIICCNENIQHSYIGFMNTMLKEYITRPSEGKDEYAVNNLHWDLYSKAGIKDEKKRKKIIDAILGPSIPGVEDNHNENEKGGEA